MNTPGMSFDPSAVLRVTRGEAGILVPANPLNLGIHGTAALLTALESAIIRVTGEAKAPPAAIIDGEGNLICLAVPSTLPNAAKLETPVSMVVRHVTRIRSVPDLFQNAGVALVTIAVPSPTGVATFVGMGDLYNGAPTQVHGVVRQQLDLSGVPYQHASAAAMSYWDEAKARRSVVLTTHSCSSLHSGGQIRIGELKFSPLEIPMVVPNPQVDGLSQFRVGDVIDLTNPESTTSLMKVLHALARDNVGQGGGPFAAAIVKDDRIIGLGANSVFPSSDPTAHGERVALWDAARRYGHGPLEGSIVVTSSFTCIGCAEACARVGVREILFGNTRDEVQTNTPFTEGPLHEEFFRGIGINVRQVDVGDPNLALAGFRRFGAQGKSYLLDGSRDGKPASE